VVEANLDAGTNGEELLPQRAQRVAIEPRWTAGGSGNLDAIQTIALAEARCNVRGRNGTARNERPEVPRAVELAAHWLLNLNPPRAEGDCSPEARNSEAPESELGGLVRVCFVQGWLRG
jgi:hypothetical protein